MHPTRSLASYLSATHREQLAARAGRGDRDAPRETRHRGALLFLDVSGFTRITERFAAEGPQGAERLAGAFDVCFGGVFDRILARGGDVLAFAGDAVLALWLADGPADEALANATDRAARCGHEVLARFDGHPLGQGDSFRLRAALGAGDLDALEVGGVAGRWECLVVGDALEQARAADTQGRPGQLVFSPQARALAEAGSVEGARRRAAQGAHEDRASPRSPAPEFVLPCVPPIVAARHAAGQRDWIAEFRTATVVFARLLGLERAAPGRCLVAHRAVAAAQQVMAEYGGGVHQVQADDKDVRLLGGFGLPMFTHPDDAARAVAAATELWRRLQGLAVPAAVGVATGRIFCGTFGCEDRADYAIRGSVVNRAARIMVAAPLIVLCDAETMRAAGSKLAFAALAPMNLKGIPERVPIFRPIPADVTRRSASRAAESEPLVGRQHEIERLARRIDALQQERRGGLVRVTGEAGIGKSHLLAAVVEAATRKGVRVLSAEGDSLESSTAYFAWRALLLQLLSPAAPTAPPIPERLRAALAAQLDGFPTLLSWAPVLGAALPLDLPDNAVTSQMDAAARADATEQVVVHLLRAEAARGDVAIFVDDAHWLDSRSRALLHAVARQVPAILTVVGSRPVAEAGARAGEAELLTDGEAEGIVLGPLGAACVATLIEQQLGVSSVAAELAAFVYERAEGHPLYSREIIRELLDARMLIVEGRTCRMAPAAPRSRATGFPRSLKAVITSRIDRLPPREQLLVKTASVLGRSFGRDALGALLGELDAAAMDAPLEQLTRRGVLRFRGDVDHEFTHSTTQEVAYDLLPFVERRTLHARAARWIEATHARGLEPYSALLAHHWLAAEEPRKALGFFEKAAEHAFRTFSNREAVAFLTEAIALSAAFAVTPARRAGWERILGEAHVKLGEYPQARAHLRESLRLCGRPTPSGRAALTASLVLQLGQQVLSRRRAAPPAIAESMREIERLTATDYHLLAEVSLFTHDKVGLLHSTLSSLNCGERGGSAREVVIGFGEVAYVASMVGLRGIARRYRSRSLELAEREGNLATIAFANQIAAAFGNCVGDWREVDASCLRARALFERLGDRFRWQTCAAIHGYMHLARGDLDAAEGAFEAAYASATPDGAAQVHMWARAGQLLCALARGDARLEPIFAVERVLERGVQPAEQVLGLGALAEAYERAGDGTAARLVAERALVRMRDNPPATSYVAWSLAGVTRSLIGASSASPRDAALASRARQALGILRSAARAMPVMVPAASLAAARAAALGGDLRRSRRHYREAAAAADRLQMPIERRLADTELESLDAGYHVARARLFPARFD